MKNRWQRKQIGNLREVIAGQSPEGKFYNTNGKGMPFYQGKKDFGEKFIENPTTWTTQTTKVAREGDILMSVRAPVGPVNFATDEICIGRGLAAIRTKAELNRDFPLVSSSGIIDTHNEGPVKGPGVATGRSGSIGNVFYIEEDYWPLNTVLYVKEFYDNNPKFTYRLLSHFDLKRFATGTGVPTLNRNFVHDERVVIPESNKTQRKIAEQLDGLEEKTQRLASLYERKLAALEALKKSLLHQAFTGEL